MTTWRRPPRLVRAARTIFCEMNTGTSSPQVLPSPPTHTPVSAPHPATICSKDLEKQCEVKHTRSSGPGGQHRNKVNTAVVLKHQPTGVTASATEERSQARNAATAFQRLRVRLALSLRTSPPPTERSALFAARVRGGKLSISESHTDFPSLLAEALDWIVAKEDVKVRDPGMCLHA